MKKIFYCQVKGLAAIIASFEKTIKDLDVLIAGAAEKVVANNAAIDKLTEENRDLIAENRRANDIRKNITKLIEA